MANDQHDCPQSTESTLLREVLRCMQLNTKQMEKVTGEIQALTSTVSRDLQALTAENRVLTAEVRILAHSVDRLVDEGERNRAAFLRTLDKEAAAQARVDELRDTRWGAIKAAASWLGTQLRAPLGTLSIAFVGYLIARYLAV